MKRQKLIDAIVKEPLGGAHTNREAMFDTVRKTICKAFTELKDKPTDKLVQERMEKFFAMGVYSE